MGDTIKRSDKPNQIILQQRPLRIIRGIEGEEREVVLTCWVELWRGALQSHREFMDLKIQNIGDELIWCLSPESHEG